MFEIAKIPPELSKLKRKTINLHVPEEVYKEIKQIAEKENMSITKLANQMVYSCLNRDQITGEKK